MMGQSEPRCLIEVRLEFQVSMLWNLCNVGLTINGCEYPSPILADWVVRY